MLNRVRSGIGTVSGLAEFPRQQGLIVIGIVRIRQCLEQINQVLIDIDVVGAARFNERIQIRACLRAGHRVAEEP